MEEPFIFKLRIMSEVDQQSQAFACRLKVINRLGAMIVPQLFYRFDFYDDFVETKEVGRVDMAQGQAFVIQLKTGLLNKWNALNF